MRDGIAARNSMLPCVDFHPANQVDHAMESRAASLPA